MTRFILARTRRTAQIQFRPNGSGQSLVEFALMLPVLLMLIVGVLDLGRAFFAYVTIVNAAREGARYGATYPQQSANIITRAQYETQGSAINPAQLTVASSFPSGCAAGNPIRVTVSYNFQMISSYAVGGGTIPLQSFAEMPVFGDCP